jgi:hypothetical protein
MRPAFVPCLPACSEVFISTRISLSQKLVAHELVAETRYVDGRCRGYTGCGCAAMTEC